MREIQELFNLAIELEIYPHRSDFMCIALSVMMEADHITDTEYEMATNEIMDYIHIADTDSLEDALEYSKLPYHEEDRIELYLNWENRPQLTKCVNQYDEEYGE